MNTPYIPEDLIKNLNQHLQEEYNNAKHSENKSIAEGSILEQKLYNEIPRFNINELNAINEKVNQSDFNNITEEDFTYLMGN